MPKAKVKRLTIKEEKFCKVAIATGNPTEAARQTYDLGSKGGICPDETARSLASKEMGKVHIRKRLDELLIELKLDKNSRIKRLGEIFYDTDKRSAIAANSEITKMVGEYKQADSSILTIFGKLDELQETPEQEAERIVQEEAKRKADMEERLKYKQ